MPTDMHTVTVYGDYHVVVPDTLVFTNEPAFVLAQVDGGPAPHLQISGDVDIALTSISSDLRDPVGIGTDVIFNGSPTVSIDAGATLKLSSVGAAQGYVTAPGDVAEFKNAGTFEASGDAEAEAILSDGSVENTGEILAASASGFARGVKFVGAGRQILNSGEIKVSGHTGAMAVIADGGAGVFHNTGIIVAHSDGATSIGVAWGNGGGSGSFINDGTIEADRALEADWVGTYVTTPIINNGHMIGSALIDSGPTILVNNGEITGDIRFNAGGDLYDGRLGVAGSSITTASWVGDTLLGGVGDETMVGQNGDDSMAGGGGNDQIDGGDGSNTLFGGDGDDSIAGGSGFDRVNGNVGDDTVVGHSAVGDWLSGGQGQDTIDASASTGNNIINGNLGNDTIIGGSGADSLRGGQGDDVIHAGSGNDWITGDLGTNTIFGGQGLDTVRASAGHDIVNGWHAGDRVEFASGLTYTVTQVNADVHINFSNGGEIDLIGVQKPSLPSGWIVSA